MYVKAKKNSLRLGAVAVLAGATTFAFPAFAFAAEGESGGISAILPSMTEFIPMLVAFVIVAIVLWKLGWPMFDKMLAKRENSIREALEKSEAARVESERVLAEYKAQLEDAKAQAAAIVADAKKTGEAMKADLTAKAEAEAEGMIAKATAAIEAERKAAVADLQGSVADMTVALASKIIGGDLSDDEHRKIIERYVREAGSLNAD
ncbi:MAG: F0F1 ATP synthase subunit B [Eggerthellaceae bacterium]|nr:F0F1 ATP synthase subunit B [Eggerthellaceae bacterium]